MQEDGNLVLAEHGKAVWTTGTNGQNVVRAEVQRDGNFVLYKSDKSIFTSDKAVWSTDTKGKKNVKLVLQDDRNLVLYAENRSGLVVEDRHQGAAAATQSRRPGSSRLGSSRHRPGSIPRGGKGERTRTCSATAAATASAAHLHSGVR